MTFEIAPGTENFGARWTRKRSVTVVHTQMFIQTCAPRKRITANRAHVGSDTCNIELTFFENWRLSEAKTMDTLVTNPCELWRVSADPNHNKTIFGKRGTGTVSPDRVDRNVSNRTYDPETIFRTFGIYEGFRRYADANGLSGLFSVQNFRRSSRMEKVAPETMYRFVKNILNQKDILLRRHWTSTLLRSPSSFF